MSEAFTSPVFFAEDLCVLMLHTAPLPPPNIHFEVERCCIHWTAYGQAFPETLLLRGPMTSSSFTCAAVLCTRPPQDQFNVMYVNKQTITPWLIEVI